MTSEVGLFADGTAIYREVNNMQNFQTLQDN